MSMKTKYIGSGILNFRPYAAGGGGHPNTPVGRDGVLIRTCMCMACDLEERVSAVELCLNTGIILPFPCFLRCCYSAC